MLLRIATVAPVTAVALILAAPAESHGGRTDANGCHMDRKAGKRHCHGKGARRASAGGSRARAAPQRAYGGGGGSAYYPNCASARAAGAAPIYAGQPGYNRRLDRDGDGVACE